MELDENGFFEELLAQRRQMWEDSSTSSVGEFFSRDSGSSFDCCFEEGGGGGDGGWCPLLPNPAAAAFDVLGMPLDLGFGGLNPTVFCPPPPAPPGAMLLASVPPEIQLSPEDCPWALEEKDVAPIQHQGHGLATGGSMQLSSGSLQVVSKLEELAMSRAQASGPAAGTNNGADAAALAAFDLGSSSSSCPPYQRKARAKKVDGQPSKNLLAERRRRKRLNDRLSMLRSVVPKISKMDRTSILGDTIDYMKELLERIKRLQGGMESGGGASSASEESPPLDLHSLFQCRLNPDEAPLVRNTPKFGVERREADTRVDVYCAAKPGLLLSILSTLEEVGLQIEQCVISCFSDFGMQASCSEDVTRRTLTSSEDIKQALIRNTGHGGRLM